MKPTSFVAVDWSGAKETSKLKTLWAARAEGKSLLELIQMPSRRDAIGYVIERCNKIPATIVGLDFAFSVPKWFAAELGAHSYSDLWSRVRRDGEQWLLECKRPFWGLGGARPHADDNPYRETERSLESVGGIKPKSVFQINYPGAVGKGSIRGIPHLLELQQAGINIWPFQPAALPMAVEIYPRLLTGVVKKSDPNARREYLAQCSFKMSPAHRRFIEQSDDAFDAAISALVMARSAGTFPTSAKSKLAAIEGEIWNPV